MANRAVWMAIVAHAAGPRRAAAARPGVWRRSGDTRRGLCRRRAVVDGSCSHGQTPLATAVADVATSAASRARGSERSRPGVPDAAIVVSRTNRTAQPLATRTRPQRPRWRSDRRLSGAPAALALRTTVPSLPAGAAGVDPRAAARFRALWA